MILWGKFIVIMTIALHFQSVEASKTTPLNEEDALPQKPLSSATPKKKIYSKEQLLARKGLAPSFTGKLPSSLGFFLAPAPFYNVSVQNWRYNVHTNDFDFLGGSKHQETSAEMSKLIAQFKDFSIYKEKKPPQKKKQKKHSKNKKTKPQQKR